jgi:MSHA biogenesis protein MshO
MTPFNQKGYRSLQLGFTLIEFIIVIVLMGVIGGMVTVFMKSPIDAYLASGRRAALTDTADTVVRRMARDIRKALPNSINTSGDNQCVEFIPTKAGGRYRAEEITPGDGSSLLFGSADGRFNMLGSNTTFAGNPIPDDQQIKAVAGEFDVIALTNLGFGVADAYAGSNTAVLSGVSSGTETTLTFGTQTFDMALASPNNRFQVIPANEKVVAYVCTSNKVYRLVSTSLGHICPTAAVTSTSPDVSAAPVLAQNVTCTFDYSGSDLRRHALLSMRIQVTESSESVTLQHEVHVSNTP